MVQSKLARRMSGPAPRPRPAHPARAFSADLASRPNRNDLWRLTVKPEEEEDVIDLGAPRKVRLGRSLGPAPPRPNRVYTPNPRLYPGPQKPTQVKQKRKPSGAGGHRKKNAFRRPVPNSRLYRPVPPRPPPPPAYPRTVWHPPTQGQLDTASRVALRLSHGVWAPPSKRPSANTLQRGPPSRITRKRKLPTLRTRRSPTCSPARHIKPQLAASPSQTQKLVITLPAAGDGNPPTDSTELGLPYRPTSQHFRDRQSGSPGDSTPTGGRVIQFSTRGIMDATQRHSTSPEDCSEGNDSHSAPSEFLAEFLSAIMRRQYAEALKYCRLILQYEPRNATARGFYPLLQQKLAHQSPRAARDKPATRARHQRSPRISRSPDLAGGSSGANSGGSSPVPPDILPHEVMEQEADSLSCSGPRPGSAGSSEPEPEPGLGSVSSQSSLELDSSEPARSEPSLSLSRRTDRTDSASASVSASGAWDSSGSGAGARDDNGNPAPLPELTPCCDAENNQPATSKLSPLHSARARPLTLQSEQSTESLRRLRAQFTCSIK